VDDRIWQLTAVAAVAIAVGGAPISALAQKEGGDAPPISLRLATLETPGSAWHEVMVEMAADISTATHDSLTIEVIEDFVPPDAALPEQSVVNELSGGRADLALVPSRGWLDAGVSSLRALQTPFLITSLEQAEAVATSDLAERMLSDMSSAGLLGLAMWPDDLRHPVAYDECASGPFLRPSDMAGMRVRSVPSADSYALLRAFDAIPVYESYGMDSCELAGHEAGLHVDLSPPDATATGNVTFFPRMFVLAADVRTLERLDGAQLAALREAAAHARDRALLRVVPESALATTWCETYRQRIVHATAADLDAWHEAAAPVVARLREDPAAARDIDEIRAMAERVGESPPAAACQPTDRNVPDPIGSHPPGSPGWTAGMWPPGVYRMELTREQALSAPVPDLLAMVGANTLTLDGNTFRIDLGTPDPDAADCHGTVTLVGDVIHTEWVSTALCGGWADLRWRLIDDDLHLDLVDSNFPEVDAVWFESNPWVLIDRTS
jgi:TRAP-type C4-dicarboxylate transport system substrate-binding protein